MNDGDKPRTEVSPEVSKLLERHARYSRWRASPWPYVIGTAVVALGVGLLLLVLEGPGQGLAAVVGVSLLGARVSLLLRDDNI